MRKTFTMLLLASALTAPALAQENQGRWQRGNAEMRANRTEAPRNWGERRLERQQEARQERADVRRDVRRENQGEIRRDRVEVRRDRADVGNDRRDAWRNRQPVANAAATAEQRRDWRQDRREDRREVRDDRRDRRVDRNDRRWSDNRQVDRDWRNRNDNRWSDNRDWGRRDRDWNRNWRSDRRYDWRGWRNQYRDRYHIGRYSAPRGYHYNRWYVGYRLDPWFYGSSYWIDDPFHYRLPPAYGGYRWIRYFDDVILVDMRSGRIVDIIHDFFW